MKGTLSSGISLANTLSPDLKNIVDTSKITDALAQTDKLTEMCKNLSTEECSKKQILQQAENDAAQLKFYKDTLAASIKTLSDARVPIQTKLDAIVKKGVTGGGIVVKGSEIIPQYEDILSRIDGDIVVLRASVPYINPPASTAVFAGSSGSGSTRPEYVLPSVGTATSYTGEFERLNILYNNATGVPLSPEDVDAQVKRVLRTIVIPMSFYASLAFAAVLGGIALSNFFIEEKSLYIRIYYFIWGMLGFPASLLYFSLIKTPFWVSILPVYPRLTPLDTSASPDKVNVKGNKATPTIEGIPAPSGMMWIKALSSDAFFSYLISLTAAKMDSTNLPAVPGNHWISSSATSGQQLWSLEYGPAATPK
jgi:hypothetical protein